MELEINLHCENCGSSARVIYDEDSGYDPEFCPFCGENVITDEFEDEDEYLDSLDDEELDDDNSRC